MGTYDKEVAEAIIKCRQNTMCRRGLDGEHEEDDFIIKDDGVYPAKGVASSKQEFQDAVWRPACDLNAQEKSTWKQPSLPIPFNEKQLAAFFMHGNGWYVRDSFGAWDDGPDDAGFEIDPDDEIASLVMPEVQEVVIAAYAAYRAAECAVGPFDNTLARMAQELDDAFWNGDVSLRTAELREALRIAYEKADDAELAWRKKMVNQLLAVELIPVPDGIGSATSTANKVKNDVSVNAGEQQSSEANTPQQVELVPPPPAVEPASEGPAKHKRTKRRTWRDVSLTYLTETFKSEQYPTVKEFFKILQRKAGAGSPFDNGIGPNHGNLFAREVSEKVTPKMIEGFVTEIRKQR